MKRIGRWIWKKGIVSTFMTGFFVLLPFMITLGVIGWAGSLVASWLGPSSSFGRGLHTIGMQFLTDEKLGTLVGWVMVLLGIWLIGLLFKTFARHRIQKRFNQAIERIPLINVIYKPVAQVVSMLQDSDDEQMKSMTVVYCSFGKGDGAGFLALLASPEVFHFNEQQSHAVYIPTSPVPMSGGIVFIPVANVQPVSDMQVDDLMQIYFSLGVMAPKVIPEAYRAAS
ncbi:MAG: DUF502 domain-containing protein [Planctomycetales bacterium]